MDEEDIIKIIKFYYFDKQKSGINSFEFSVLCKNRSRICKWFDLYFWI